MSEIKDNNIVVSGSVMNMVEKTVNKDQVVELHIRIPAKEFDGKRDALASALAGRVQITLTPQQTELDMESEIADKPADGQTELIDEAGQVNDEAVEPVPDSDLTEEELKNVDIPEEYDEVAGN